MPNHLKVLFVDDEEDFCTSSVMRLKEEGYDASFAKSGQEAVDIIRNYHVDILIIDYFMMGYTGEQAIRQIRTFNKDIIIILQTAYSGQKPPVEMLDALDIHGYYDKSEEFQKLLCWVKVAARICLQMQQMKKMFERVQLANKTIEEVQRDKQVLIEQTRLASIGELTGVVSENIIVPLETVKLFLRDNIKAGLDKIEQLLESNDWTLAKRLKCKQELSQARQFTCTSSKILEDTRQCVSTLRNQMAKTDVSFQSKSFSLTEVMNIFAVLVKEMTSGCNFAVNNKLVDSANSMVFSGKIVNLVQVLLKLTTIIIENNKKDVYDLSNLGGTSIELEVGKNEEDVEFVFVYNGTDTIDDMLREVIFTKHVDDLSIGLYTIYSIVIEQFNGRIWSTRDGDKQITKIHVSIPTANS